MRGTAPQPAPQLTTPISVCRPSFRLVSGPPLSPWWNIIMVVLVMTLTIMAIGVDSCHSATGQLREAPIKFMLPILGGGKEFVVHVYPQNPLLWSIIRLPI